MATLMMLTPRRERIEKALRLFLEEEPGVRYSCSTVFHCLGAELFVRHSAFSQLSSPPPFLPLHRELVRLFTNSSLRLTDLMMRPGLIEVVRSHFAALPRDEALPWYGFGGLCIKDFHVDLGSFMDSVAPVVLQACGSFQAKGKVKLPGFPDVQTGGSQRAATFRASLPEAVLVSIDRTDEWWPSIKAIRDMLAHREHQKSAFGGPSEGVLFQVFEPTFSPKVVHPAFLRPPGHNVADFQRYSAYVIAEVLLFLDELGNALAEHLKLSPASLTQSSHVGNFSNVISPLRDMLESSDL